MGGFGGPGGIPGASWDRSGPWAPEAAGRQPTFLEPGGSGGAEPPLHEALKGRHSAADPIPRRGNTGKIEEFQVIPARGPQTRDVWNW